MTDWQGMAQALAEAGFPGVELGEVVIFARIDGPASAEFEVLAAEGGFRLVLRWNIRPTASALADWNARHSEAQLSCDLGEATLSMLVPAGGQELAAALRRWSDHALEAAVLVSHWRQDQRPIHGM